MFNRLPSRSLLILPVLLLLLLFQLISSLHLTDFYAHAHAGEQASEVQGASPELLRGWEPITLTPRELPELQGKRLSSLRVLVWRSGWHLIPFQLDEKDEHGRYVLTEGPQPQRGDGLFSGQDELFLLRRDLGIRPPSLEGLPCGEGVLLSLGRQGGMPLGYGVVVSCPSMGQDISVPAPVSLALGVETEDYQLRFEGAQPMEPVGLIFKRGLGGSGLNLLRGLFVEGEASFLVGLVRVTRGMEHFRSSLVSWKVGPLRSFRRTAPRIQTYGQRYTNEGTFTLDSIHQAGTLTFDLQMHTSSALGSWLTDLVLRVAWDFQGVEGMVLSTMLGEGVGRVDGQLSPAESLLESQDSRWLRLEGRQGQFLGMLSYHSAQPLVRRLYYRELGPGQLRAGFELHGLHRAPVGRTWYRATFWNLGRGGAKLGAEVLERQMRPIVRVKE